MAQIEVLKGLKVPKLQTDAEDLTLEEFKGLWNGLDQVGGTGESIYSAAEFVREGNGKGSKKGRKMRIFSCMMFVLKPRGVLIQGVRGSGEKIQRQDGSTVKVDETLLQFLPWYTDKEAKENEEAIKRRMPKLGKFSIVNFSRLRRVMYLATEYQDEKFMYDLKYLSDMFHNGTKASEVTGFQVDASTTNADTRIIMKSNLEKFRLNSVYWKKPVVAASFSD